MSVPNVGQIGESAHQHANSLTVLKVLSCLTCAVLATWDTMQNVCKLPCMKPAPTQVVDDVCEYARIPAITSTHPDPRCQRRF